VINCYQLAQPSGGLGGKSPE